MLYNLREYYRPDDVAEALRLLRRADVRTVPLAGGTDLVGQRNPEVEAVVDLAGLELDGISLEGGTLRLGAMVRLQTIVDELGDVFGGLLADAAHRMAGWNVRNSATIGGTLAGRKLHSPLGVALAALGAEVATTGSDELIQWPQMPAVLSGELITEVVITVYDELGTAYEQVGRTPADQPIINAAAAVRALDEGMLSARVVVGGLLADDLKLLDLGIELPGLDISEVDDIAAGLNEADLQSDYLGSAAYRRAVAPVVARRALASALAAVGYVQVEG